MNTKFKAGDKVAVRFGGVAYNGIVSIVIPLGTVGTSSYQLYVVSEGKSYRLYNGDNRTDAGCSFDRFVWPEYCLSLIPEPPKPVMVRVGEYDAQVSPDGATVTVGCQTIPRAQVEQVLTEMQKLAAKS